MINLHTVLLVDDDDISNFIISRMLEKEGLCQEIMIARNGKKGIEILQNCIKCDAGFPDLILLDVNMPIFSGIDFLNHLKHSMPAINSVIIAISNAYKEDQKEEMTKLGVKGFLSKPVMKEKLVEALGKQTQS